MKTGNTAHRSNVTVALAGTFSLFRMALTWAVVWAPIGVLTAMIVDPAGSMDESWVVVGAYPGFLCGAVFSTVLGIAESRLRIHQLSLSQVGAWGAVSGLLVGLLLPFIVGTLSTQLPPWLWGVVIICPVTLMSSVSAVGTALLARMAMKLKLRDAERMLKTRSRLLDA